jgi:site-specific DNA recombinase
MTPKRRTIERVTLYARASVARGYGETSPERQLDRCRDYAKAQRWTIVGEYKDRVSAFKRGVRRPGWDKVVADVDAGRTDAVLVHALDRAFRNAAEALKFVERCEDHNVAFVSSTQPIDTSSTYGKIILSVLAAVAEVEAAVRRERALSKYQEKAELGEWAGSNKSFGYTVDMKVIPAEADAIRGGAAAILNGVSVGTIAREWNADGHRTARGSKFTVTSVKQVYRRSSIAGLRPLDGKLVRGKWEPILSRTDWERVQDVFDARLGTSVKRTDKYLLTGLLTCGRCGGKMVGSPLNGTPNYICRATGHLHLRIVCSPLDKYVLQRASRMTITDAETVTNMASVSPELRARLDAVGDRIAELIDELSKPGAPVAVLTRAVAKAEAERDELTVQLEESGGQFRRLLEVVERGERPGRAEIEERVESITVKPSAVKAPRAFDRGRVEIVWRDGVEELDLGRSSIEGKVVRTSRSAR